MFLVIAVGYYLRKKKIVDAAFSKGLSKLVLHVTQPVLIISSMIKMKFSADNTKMVGIVFIISILVHIVAALLGRLSMRIMKDEDSRKLSELSLIFANCMFFGIPIAEPLFGVKGVFWISFYSIFFHIFSWTYGLIVLGRGRDDIKLNPKKVFFNYGTVPCAIGVVLYFLSFDIPAAVTTAFGYIGGMCTPISLLVLGGVLATVPVKKLVCDWKIYYVSLFKLIIFPLVCYIVAKYIGNLGDELSMFVLLMAALPTASLTNMFAELYDVNPGYAAKTVGMTTVISVATLPFVVYIAQLL